MQIKLVLSSFTTFVTMSEDNDETIQQLEVS